MIKKIGFDKKFVESVFSLSTSQFINYLSPLITFPILLKKLGIEDFGVLSTAFTISLFLGIVCDYGFSVSGIKLILQKETSKDHTFNSIFFIKLIIALIGIFIYLIIIKISPSYKPYEKVFIFSIGMVLAKAFNCDWFFQSTEKMRYIIITNFVANAFFVGGVILFTYLDFPFEYVSLFRSVGLLLAGIMSFVIVLYQDRIRMTFVGDNIVNCLKQGFPVFMSTMANNFLHNTPLLLIKSLYSFDAAGVFSSIEKVVSFGRQMIMVFNQAYYPKLIQMHEKSINRFFGLWKKSTILGLVVSIILVLGLVIFKNAIFDFFSELKNYPYSSTYFYILVSLIITHSIITSLGMNGLIVIGKSKQLITTQVYPLAVYISISGFLFLLDSPNILTIPILLLIVDIIIAILRTIIFTKTLKREYL